MRRSHKTSRSKYKHIAVSKSKEREAKDKNRRDKGDRVLVTTQSVEGKLLSYWENNIYKIVGCKGEDSLAYEVQP